MNSRGERYWGRKIGGGCGCQLKTEGAPRSAEMNKVIKRSTDCFAADFVKHFQFNASTSLLKG